jgi:hypothetical protein
LASDDPKDRSKFDVLDSDEDGWSDAIDEWDKALDFFHEAPAAKKPKTAPAEA